MKRSALDYVPERRIMLSMIAMARRRDDDLMRRCVDAYAHKRIDMFVR